MNDGSKERTQITAGLDLGDKYSYLCLLNTDSGEVLEEGKLRTTPEQTYSHSLRNMAGAGLTESLGNR